MQEQMLNRRYVGRGETIAYIAQDFADSFSIGKYQNRFIWDVVGIDFKINGIVSLFTGASMIRLSAPLLIRPAHAGASSSHI